MVALNVLAALARLASAGSRAAPAMESSAAALRAARIARAARGTESMEGANRGFTLVKPPGTSLAPRGSTMPVGGAPPAGPGTGVALRGSTMPAAPPAGGLPAGIASPPPAGGGALVPRGAGLPAGGAPVGASPDIYGKIGGAMLTGGVGANVASQSPTGLLDFLPQRAEGDPAGAINRRNDPGAERPNLFDETNIGAPQFTPQRDNMFEETNIGAPQFMPEPASDPGRSDYDALYRSLQGASQRRSAPADRPEPPPRPSDGPSSAELMRQYNESMRDDGGGQASLLALAERAQREGRASGGAASSGGMSSGGGGKDAAIHKALEIIHHLLTRR